MSPFAIRPVAPGDLEALVRLERESFDAPWDQLALEPALDSESHLLLVAEERLCAAGFALFLRLPGECELLRVAVAAQARGRGLGTGLVQQGLALLEAEGRPNCHLEVRPSNLEARRLYARLGFQVVATRPGYYADGEAALLYRRTAGTSVPG